AMVLIHDAQAGRQALAGIGRNAGAAVARAPAVTGLPARTIPVEVHHVASVGIDVALAAIAFGASQVAVLSTGREAPQYVAALREQFAIADSLLEAFGYRGRHFAVIEAADAAALEAALSRLEPAETVVAPATFAVSDEKRRSIEFAIDHLVAQADPARQPLPQQVTLPTGSPFGAIRVDSSRCTLCLACIGSCPEAALLDNPDRPQLRFIERNCVQCGLCASTCPEDAITLHPRYLVDSSQARSPAVLNEAQPFDCVRCGKPFGTRQMIDNMLARLSGHGMFGGTAARRLQMCADCRVVDMFSATDELTINEVRPGQG
ncbi:MAG TPA: 4Fe-4S binding protein, partial [Burkholderiaceae bacterium]|nr:4Fe-4S binding protein [Burkholderiaceae bacterium]